MRDRHSIGDWIRICIPNAEMDRAEIEGEEGRGDAERKKVN
jgi:hypothetical protein